MGHKYQLGQIVNVCGTSKAPMPEHRVKLVNEECIIRGVKTYLHNDELKVMYRVMRMKDAYRHTDLYWVAEDSIKCKNDENPTTKFANGDKVKITGKIYIDRGCGSQDVPMQFHDEIGKIVSSYYYKGVPVHNVQFISERSSAIVLFFEDEIRQTTRHELSQIDKNQGSYLFVSIVNGHHFEGKIIHSTDNNYLIQKLNKVEVLVPKKDFKIYAEVSL